MEILAQARGWISFVGWLGIIAGALGLLQFPEGTVIGIIGIISGSFLVQTASALKAGHEKAENENDVGKNLKRYFILQGILAIVTIILSIFAAIQIMSGG